MPLSLYSTIHRLPSTTNGRCWACSTKVNKHAKTNKNGTFFMFITFYGLLFVSFGWTMSISKVEPSGLVNPFLIYTPFCAFKVTVFPEPTVTLPTGFLSVDVMNDVSPFNDWKEKSVLLNANEYSRVRWAFAPNGIAVHRHRSQRIGFVIRILFIRFCIWCKIPVFFLNKMH